MRQRTRQEWEVLREFAEERLDAARVDEASLLMWPGADPTDEAVEKASIRGWFWINLLRDIQQLRHTTGDSPTTETR